jgi:hypothetical protein
MYWLNGSSWSTLLLEHFTELLQSRSILVLALYSQMCFCGNRPSDTDSSFIITNDLCEAQPLLMKLSHSARLQISCLAELKVSLSCSQERPAGPYREPAASFPHNPIVFFVNFNILRRTPMSSNWSLPPRFVILFTFGENNSMYQNLAWEAASLSFSVQVSRLFFFFGTTKFIALYFLSPFLSYL